MEEVIMLHRAEPRKILQAVIEKRIPAIMSYLSKGKWRVAKVLLTDFGADRFDIELVHRTPKPHPINIRVEQPVGLSLKYGYSKFIFETTVVGFEPSREPTGGGVIVLAIPDRIELVQRRSYFRIEVPESLKVNVMLWHRCHADSGRRVPPKRYWQSRLVDISAGGAQIAVDATQKPDFNKGQFVGLRFTPMPYEMPLMFNALIRSVLPTADEGSICLGLQIVGLEASVEGRQVLSRLVGIVERYYQINQSSGRQQDMQAMIS